MSKVRKEIELRKLIDRGLKQEPDFYLPDNFASKMAAIVERRLTLVYYLKEFLVYFSAIAGSLLVVLAIIFFYNTQSWQALTAFFASHYTTIIGVSLMLLFVLFADKVLLRYFIYRAKL